MEEILDIKISIEEEEEHFRDRRRKEMNGFDNNEQSRVMLLS